MDARVGAHSRRIAARRVGCNPPAIMLYGMVGCTHPTESPGGRLRSNGRRACYRRLNHARTGGR